MGNDLELSPGAQRARWAESDASHMRDPAQRARLALPVPEPHADAVPAFAPVIFSWWNVANTPLVDGTCQA